MCGITAFINAMKSLTSKQMDICHNKAKHRGPESTNVIYKTEDVYLGFHRLAINGLDEISNQPFELEDCILICNGEIYNYRELYIEQRITNTTNSDCEIIIHLYKKYGMKHTLGMLDGVFAFVLFDTKTNKCFIARDPYGVRPLFQAENCDDNCDDVLYGYASELKQLYPVFNNIKQFRPGTYVELTNKNGVFIKTIDEYYRELNPISTEIITKYEVMNEIKKRFTDAVTKRISSCERPIACLLSGGLDSSLVASIVSKHYKGDLETYSIGLSGSEDLKYASVVAKYLKTKHTEIVVSESDFFNAIPEVIQMIESYDITTVRASVGNYLLGKYISKNSDAKVIFNGDGSDELMGGYLYMTSAPDSVEFDCECRRLLDNIHFFDVLLSDSCI
jgi:asparagine synthase (glutamine-hydrolysing)